MPINWNFPAKIGPKTGEQVRQLIAKAGVEALDLTVFLRAASLDVSGLGTDNRDPFLHRLGDELRSVVGPDVSGNAPQDEQVGQNVDYIDRLELAGDTDRQAFVGELVEHVEHPILASIVGAILDEVIGPDMIALLRPQPNARSVGQPEPAALGLLLGTFSPSRCQIRSTRLSLIVQLARRSSAATLR